MVYTKRHPAVLVMGLALLALGYCTEAGLLDEVLKYLGTPRSKPAMITLPYTFGAIGVVIGLWQLIGVHWKSSLDYFSSALGGALFILVIAMLVRWFLDPLVAVWSKGAGPVFGGMYIHDVFGLQLHRARHRRRHRPRQCVRHPELGAERRQTIATRLEDRRRSSRHPLFSPGDPASGHRRLLR